MEDNNTAELFKYCSPESILVITWYGKLKTLYCPFGVKVIRDVGNLESGEYVSVALVKVSTGGTTVFIIEDKAYYYYYFDILTHLS